MANCRGDDRSLHLTDLPDEMLEKIMSYLTYDEIAHNRAVCKKFDRLNRRSLNRGYNLIMNRLKEFIDGIKQTLPRRESAQQKHPLYQHFSASNNIHISLRHLMWIYCRPYIQAGVSCFIAGKVIDEAFELLKVLKVEQILPAPSYEFTEEIDEDIQMAEDHFKEVIEPSLKNFIGDIQAPAWNAIQMSTSKIPKETNSGSSLSSQSIEEKLRQNVECIHYRIAKTRVAVLCLKKHLGKMSVKIKKLRQQDREENRQFKIVIKRLKLLQRKLSTQQ